MLPALTVGAFVTELESGDPDRKHAAIAQLNERIRAAEDGDQAALAEVQAVYAAVPRIAAAAVGAAHNVEAALFDAMNLGPYSRWITRKQLHELQREIAGPNPSPLETLLADHVALCHLESLHWAGVKAERLRESHAPETGEYYSRRAEQAHRQFLKAARTLATVRRLTSPVTQINLGNQQVNIAGDVR